MSDETYNGWKGYGTRASAYATWRVALEMFDGYPSQDWFDKKPTRDELADHLRETVDEYVTDSLDPDHPTGDGTNIIYGWVSAFLDDVSWEEIADNMLSDWDA